MIFQPKVLSVLLPEMAGVLMSETITFPKELPEDGLFTKKVTHGITINGVSLSVEPEAGSTLKCIVAQATKS